MKPSLSRFTFVIAFFLVIGYAFVTLRGPRGIPALLDKQREIHEIEGRNASLAHEIERKRERIRRLSQNPAEQELEIRQRLKLVRPGEKVYIVGEAQDK